jgi:hypothetical protein
MAKAHQHLIHIGLQLIDERRATINEVDARRCSDDNRERSPSSIEPDLLSVLGGYFGPEGVPCPELNPQCNRIWLPLPLNG